MEDDEGWEILPDDGFLQINDDGGKKIFSRNYGAGSGCVFKDYFICPDSKSYKFVENTEEEEEEWYPDKLIQLGNPPDHNQEEFKKISEVPFEKTINSLPPPLLLLENLKETEESDSDSESDPVSRFLFKKMMEQEFVDMKKLESPIRSMKPPPFPAVDATTFQLAEENGENLEVEVSSPRSLMKNDVKIGGFNFNIRKWSLTTGIGAICSFGIATATVCIIFSGAHQRNSKQQFQENHKLKFHIYSDEKGLKEAASRGSASMNRDRGYYTFGGYYDEA